MELIPLFLFWAGAFEAAGADIGEEDVSRIRELADDLGAFGQAEAEATNVNFYSKSRLSGIRTRDAGGVGNRAGVCHCVHGSKAAECC